MTERTLILVKPDGVRRGLVGEVVSRLERKGLTIDRMEMRTIARDLASEHYGEHAGKPFYEDLVAFITGGPLVAMVVEGEDAVAAARQIMGATNPLDAAPGSIRGEYATALTENIVHGSDSPASGEREIKLFFPDA